MESYIKLLSNASIKAEAARLGFDACGVSPALPVDMANADRFHDWLSRGCNGEMAYMANNADKRLNPALLVEGARTVVSVALNYLPAARLSPRGYAMARYAFGKDYHDIVKSKLLKLQEALGCNGLGRAFCDTAPIVEKYWAWRSGLGWIGRNTQLVIPSKGSFFFLGELVLTVPADTYDEPLTTSGCGQCANCIKACPANALGPDGLDARRCLSYLTIEHRGDLPPLVGRRMGNCIYGCDRCLEACPHNRQARPTHETAFEPNELLKAMTIDDWQRLDVDKYRQLFKGSAVKRAKFEGLKRNITLVENAGKPPQCKS